MNTLEMVNELRKNPNLKAHCVVRDELWKVKCVNGSIMWDDHFHPRPGLLNMSNRILRLNDWNIYKEEKKEVEIFHRLNIKLNNGIGKLPEDKNIIGDIYVQTLDGKLHTIRPIGKMFAVPTDDKEVEVMFKYKVVGCVCTYYGDYGGTIVMV